MRMTLAACLLLVLAGFSRAHFIWLTPEKDKNTALMIFSDSLEPDVKVPITKIAQTKLFARVGAKGETAKVNVDEAKNAYRVSLDKDVAGPYMIGGVCQYGVVSKGKNDPYRVVYYPKLVVLGGALKEHPAWLTEGTSALRLEIVAADKKGKARVIWNGKPAADVEVELTVPGIAKTIARKTDADGLFDLTAAAANGVYGIRAAFIEAQEGVLGGKKYTEIRHHATASFEARLKKDAKQQQTALVQAGDTKPVEDPAATKLLAEARAARAVWKNFGGFKADIAVNDNGAVHKGAVEVSATGKVALKLNAGEELQKWTRREIASLVAHRLPGTETLKTPCAFLDSKDQHHPLGRAVRVLNDELHSSYRIRDRQIIEVNRTGKEGRFTITVLESQLNKDKQFLPISYVFDSWDPKTGQIANAVAEHLTWQHVGGFDMPATQLIVTTSASGRDSRLITFSNIAVPTGRLNP
jgi:hypothetical protein